MATLEQAYKALRAADAAGNTEDARRLAQLIRKMEETGASQPTQQEDPRLLFGEFKPSDSLARGVVNTGLGLVESAARGIDQAGDVLAEAVTGERPGPSIFEEVAEGIALEREKGFGAFKPKTTWEDVKANPSASTIGAFALEQGVVSAPHMVAALNSLPTYALSLIGGIAEERARADGREEVTGEDLAAAAATSTGMALLERFGATGIFRSPATSAVGRVASGASREAATEFGQGVLEDLGTTAGTETGFDPARAAESGVAGAVAGGVYGGAFGGANEVVRGAVNAPEAIQTARARAAYSQNPEQVMSDLRVADLYEGRQKATGKFDSGNQIPADVQFKGVMDQLETELKDVSKALRRAGDLDKDGQKVIDHAISVAKRHNRDLAVDGADADIPPTEIDKIRDLNLDPQTEQTILRSLRDLNTATFNSLKKNKIGPIERFARDSSVAGSAAGGSIGWGLGGPIGGAVGAMAGARLVRGAGRLVDRALGLQEPEILRRAAARRKALAGQDVDYGNTTQDLAAVIKDARSRGKLVAAPKVNTTIDKVLRDRGVQRAGGWMRSIQEEANARLPEGSKVQQVDIIAAIQQLRTLGALTDQDVTELLGERNGKITDDRVYYGIQDFVIEMKGGLDQPGVSSSSNPPQSASNAPAGVEGIRNVFAYRQTMENVKAATDNAMSSAPSPEMGAVVSQIADARTPEAKKALYQQALAANPEHMQWLVEVVRPLTGFGPKAEPLKTEAVRRDSRGRPVERKRLNLEGSEAILKAFPKVIDGRLVKSNYTRKPNELARNRAEIYKAQAGIQKPRLEKILSIDEDHLKRVADWMETAEHKPSDPEVQKAYRALAQETIAQYRALGDLKVDPFDGQGEPYRNAGDMLDDVNDNNHLWFFRTDNGFGEGDMDPNHPMLQPTEFKDTQGRPLLVNDLFRVVHDYFGHAQNALKFGPKGEYNAFHEHSRMFSEDAIPALAAETLAQNAWVNFGPHLRRKDGSLPKRGDPDYVPDSKRPFADQKATVVPWELLTQDPNLHLSEEKRFEIKQRVRPEASKFASKIRKKDGSYRGAPSHITSPQKLAHLRKTLLNLAREGKPARFWYERSGRAILDAVGGDKVEAEKIAQLIAVYSQSTPVKSNFDFAIQAYLQHQAGEPVLSGRFPKAQSDKAKDILEGKNWEGRKTNNFYINLMREIDPRSVQGVTADIWMMRAFGFKNPDGTPYSGTPTDAQYDFVERETTRLIDQLNSEREPGEPEWEPQQVQAAIWIVEKANHEKTDVATSKYDYSDALQEALAQVSWESIPGRTSDLFPEMHSAPLAQRAEYHQQVSKAFLDDDGADIIAKRLGVLSPGEFEAPGYFEGNTNPGSQTQVAAPRRYKGPTYGDLEPSAKDLIDAYAVVKGILLKQDAMAWHRPWFSPKKKDANGTEVRLGRPLTMEETKALGAALETVFGMSDIAPIGSDQGVRLLNPDYLGISNAEFQKKVGEAVDMVFGDTSETPERIGFAWTGNYLSNDWKEAPNGEEYLQDGLKGRPALQRKVQDILTEIGPRVQAVNDEFASRYGWSQGTKKPGPGALSEEGPGLLRE